MVSQNQWTKRELASITMLQSIGHMVELIGFGDADDQLGVSIFVDKKDESPSYVSTVPFAFRNIIMDLIEKEGLEYIGLRSVAPLPGSYVFSWYERKDR